MFLLFINIIILASTNKREVSLQNLQVSGKVWSHDTFSNSFTCMHADALRVTDFYSK